MSISLSLSLSEILAHLSATSARIFGWIGDLGQIIYESEMQKFMRSPFGWRMSPAIYNGPEETGKLGNIPGN